MTASIFTNCLIVLLAGVVATHAPSNICAAADAITPHSPPITALAFDPASSGETQLFAVGSQAGVLLSTLADFAAKRQPIENALEGCGWDSMARIRGDELSKRWISVPMLHVSDVVFSPDGKRLVIVGGYPGETGDAAVMDVASGRVLGQKTFGEDLLTAARWDENGQHLLLAGMDGIARIVALSEDSKFVEWLNYDRHAKPLLAASFITSTSLAVTTGRDQTLKVWDIHSGESARSLHIHTGDVVSLAQQPNGDNEDTGLPVIASAAADRTVRFWQPTIGRMVRFVRLTSQPLTIGWCQSASASDSTATAHVIAACRDGQIRVLDPRSATVLSEHKLSSGWLHSLAMDSTGRSMAAGDSEGSLYLFW